MSETDIVLYEVQNHIAIIGKDDIVLNIYDGLICRKVNLIHS